MSYPVPEESESTAVTTRNRARDMRLVVTGVFAGLLLWFALVNLQDVKIEFWLTSTRAPLIVVIAISGVLGAGVAELVGRIAHRKRPEPEPEV